MFEERLIAAVKARSCLFDQSQTNYRSKIEKDKAWKEVAAITGVNQERCHARWKSLRDRFGKEITKQTNPNYKPRHELRWKHFKALKFLASHYLTRIKNTKDEEDACKRTLETGDLDWACDEYTSMPFSADNNFIVHEPNTSPDVTQSPDDTRMTTVQTKRINNPEDVGERLGVMIDAVTDLVSKATQARAKSRNDNFLNVLDEFLLKLPDDMQDRLKINILNLVFAEVSKYQSQERVINK